jgi:hypothetical protein
VPLPAILAGIAGRLGGASAGAALNSAGIAAFNVQAITGAVQQVGGAFKSLLSSLNPVTPALKVFTLGIDLLQAPMLGLVGALRGFRDSVGALGSAVSEFVRLASPVHVQLFNLAMDDLTASIGKILIPVLKASTAFVRMFGDVIYRLSGPFQQLMSAFFDPITELLPELVNAFAPLLDAFGEIAKIAASVLAPVMKQLAPLFADVAIGLGSALAALASPAILAAMAAMATAVTVLVSAFAPLIAILGALGYAVQKTFEYIGRALGIKPAAGGSVGAAVRPATIGSVEEYGKKAQQAAFSLGSAATPEAMTADYVKKLYEYLTGGFWQALKDLLPDRPKVPGADTARDLVKDARDAGRHVEEGTATRGERLFDAATLGGIRRRLF